VEGVSAGAEQVLMSGAWLGNVRELRNVLERACMLADGRALTERDVAGAMPATRDPQPQSQPPSQQQPQSHGGTPASPQQDLGGVERDHIVRVLADVRGNKQAAARRLGISRRTLYRRLERHGLLEVRRL
jgi:two-component system response regulator AtoC